MNRFRLIAKMPEHPHFLWADLFRHRKSKKSTVVEVLKENILFCTLSNRELQWLSKLVYERVYQPNEPIFNQNDRGFGMYLIEKGRVAIKTQAPEREVLETVLTKDGFFGELSLVEPNHIRTATAEAIERTVLIGFFKPDLMEILERKPAMGVKILFQLATVLGRRLSETTEKITLLSQTRGIGKIHEEVF